MADMIWLRGQQPEMDIELVTEGASEVVFKRAGKTTTVAAQDVLTLRHGDMPHALAHALERMDKGDFKAAENLLEPLAATEGWLGAHAGFHRANARRLRAELEGKGHDEALALLDAWREKHAD